MSATVLDDDGGDVDSTSLSAMTSSPVQVLDERLHVTTPATWMLLVGVVVLMAAGLTWAVLGRSPTEVRGRSTLVPPDGLYEVGIGVEGFVEELLVDDGDSVSEGQVLARIRQGDGQVAEIRSPVDGRVLSLLMKRGTYSRAGAAMATLEPAGSELLGALYVPAEEGKVISPGMKVFLSPSTAPAAQYGSMVGRVVEVSDLPVTQERLEVTLGDNRPLQEFLAGGGPVLEVAVELERDPSTPSGYRWTSGSGPPFAITSATLGTGTVVVSERSPASQVLG